MKRFGWWAFGALAAAVVGCGSDGSVVGGGKDASTTDGSLSQDGGLGADGAVADDASASPDGTTADDGSTGPGDGSVAPGLDGAFGPDGSVSVNCTAFGGTCAFGASCCSGVCDTTAGTCGSSIAVCAPATAACAGQHRLLQRRVRIGHVRRHAVPDDRRGVPRRGERVLHGQLHRGHLPAHRGEPHVRHGEQHLRLEHGLLLRVVRRRPLRAGRVVLHPERGHLLPRERLLRRHLLGAERAGGRRDQPGRLQPALERLGQLHRGRRVSLPGRQLRSVLQSPVRSLWPVGRQHLPARAGLPGRGRPLPDQRRLLRRGRLGGARRR